MSSYKALIIFLYIYIYLYNNLSRVRVECRLLHRSVNWIILGFYVFALVWFRSRGLPGSPRKPRECPRIGPGGIPKIPGPPRPRDKKHKNLYFLQGPTVTVYFTSVAIRNQPRSRPGGHCNERLPAPSGAGNLLFQCPPGPAPRQVPDRYTVK